MNKMIGKSEIDWAGAHEGATHFKHGLFYRQHQGVWEYHNGAWWIKSSNNSNTNSWFKNAVSKDEDLEMNKKDISCIEELQTGMFVFMQGGYSAYVNIDYCGRIGFLFTNQHENVNYSMQSGFDGLEYPPNKIYSITHWSYSLAGVRFAVATSEADIKIKELEATIALAQKQLQEYKEMK